MTDEAYNTWNGKCNSNWNAYNTCFALSDGNRHFLVDTGGGNRILKTLKDTGIQLEDIHDIFITHEHIDHLLGVIWLIRMIGQKKIGQGKYEGNLRIYCHEELARSIPHRSQNLRSRKR